jgi:hypothetical protein
MFFSPALAAVFFVLAFLMGALIGTGAAALV